jgi:hypothetical protein
MVDEMKRVAAETATAVRSAPLALVILVLNGGFLWFGAYILGELASNNVQRDKAQFELIEKLIHNAMTMECRPTPQSPPTVPTLPK